MMWLYGGAHACGKTNRFLKGSRVEATFEPALGAAQNQHSEKGYVRDPTYLVQIGQILESKRWLQTFNHQPTFSFV